MNKEQMLEFISRGLNEKLRELEKIQGIEIDFDSNDWTRLEQKILLTIKENTLQPY